MWLGGSDILNEGTWTWAASGAGFTYTNWNQGEPNGLDSENCVHMWADESDVWNDVSCDASMSVLCEIIFTC